MHDFTKRPCKASAQPTRQATIRTGGACGVNIASRARTAVSGISIIRGMNNFEHTEPSAQGKHGTQRPDLQRVRVDAPRSPYRNTPRSAAQHASAQQVAQPAAQQATTPLPGRHAAQPTAAMPAATPRKARATRSPRRPSQVSSPRRRFRPIARTPCPTENANEAADAKAAAATRRARKASLAARLKPGAPACLAP